MYEDIGSVLSFLNKEDLQGNHQCRPDLHSEVFLLHMPSQCWLQELDYIISFPAQ